jgi:hypothetical protein
VATAKILAVKAGTTVDPAHLPCHPACLVLFLPLMLASAKEDFLQTNMP